jgi:nucleotide-binding universal stress UspA family protein
VAEIVVGIDGSPASAEALHLALREARLRGARVRAVHVWHGDEAAARRLLADAVDGAPVEQVLIEDVSPAAAIARAAEGADLLVLGTRGRGGLHELLDGSVSFDCRRHAACPVMVVTAPHRTPLPAA